MQNQEIKIKYDELIKKRNETQKELFNLIGEMALLNDSQNFHFNENGHFICTSCGSHHTCKNGKNKQGKQKYRCKDCGAVRTSTKGTLTFSSKKDISQWLIFIKSLFDGDTLNTSAEKANISNRTAFRWRHKILYILNNLLNQEVLDDIVYLDETIYPVVFKDRNNPNICETRKRGMSNQKINVTCAIDSQKRTILKVIDRGRVSANSLIKVYDKKIKKGSTVVTDSLRSYHKLMKHLEIEWKKIPSKKKSIENYNLDPINHLHAIIKDFTYKYKGISIKYLQGYMALFDYLRRHEKYYRDDVFLEIINVLFSTNGHLKCTVLDSKQQIYA